MTSAAPAARPTWREWWAAAKTPRMLGVLALLVVACVVCVRLGAWQIDRAFERAEAARQAESLELAQSDAVPMGEVLGPGEHVLGTMLGIPVTVTGSYVPEYDFLVPERVVNGEGGYLVVSALQTDDGAWLPVVRGFVTDPADVAQAPDGEVSLLGSIGSGEGYVPQELPPGQLSSISPALFAGVWGTPIYNAYLVLAQADGEMTTVPRPELDGQGVDLRNLGYAIEWFVFGAFALWVWYRLVRDEARNLRDDVDGDGDGESDGENGEASEPGPDPGPEPDTVDPPVTTSEGTR